jgi:hypothetical protein
MKILARDDLNFHQKSSSLTQDAYYSSGKALSFGSADLAQPTMKFNVPLCVVWT